MPDFDPALSLDKESVTIGDNADKFSVVINVNNSAGPVTGQENPTSGTVTVLVEGEKRAERSIAAGAQTQITTGGISGDIPAPPQGETKEYDVTVETEGSDGDTDSITGSVTVTREASTPQSELNFSPEVSFADGFGSDVSLGADESEFDIPIRVRNLASLYTNQDGAGTGEIVVNVDGQEQASASVGVGEETTIVADGVAAPGVGESKTYNVTIESVGDNGTTETIYDTVNVSRRSPSSFEPSVSFAGAENKELAPDADTFEIAFSVDNRTGPTTAQDRAVPGEVSVVVDGEQRASEQVPAGEQVTVTADGIDSPVGGQSKEYNVAAELVGENGRTDTVTGTITAARPVERVFDPAVTFPTDGSTLSVGDSGFNVEAVVDNTNSAYESGEEPDSGGATLVVDGTEYAQSTVQSGASETLMTGSISSPAFSTPAAGESVTLDASVLLESDDGQSDTVQEAVSVSVPEPTPPSERGFSPAVSFAGGFDGDVSLGADQSEFNIPIRVRNLTSLYTNQDGAGTGEIVVTVGGEEVVSEDVGVGEEKTIVASVEHPSGVAEREYTVTVESVADSGGVETITDTVTVTKRIVPSFQITDTRAPDVIDPAEYPAVFDV